jgi:hypothetical protein
MKLIGVVSVAVLSLTLGVAAPLHAQQEQHEQKEEQKAKPEHNEKKAQPEKAARQEQKPSAQHEQKAESQEKSMHQERTTKVEKRSAPQQHAANRIPDERFKANFGQDHRFRVSQAEYSGGRRFEYGGYWFGFVDPWPSNWLYTQDVFVVEINGIYYLCNPMYPGVNVALNVTL